MDHLPHEPLGNRIAELSAHLDAAKSRLIALIGEFDSSGGWADEGCLSCAHWLNWKCGVSAPAAREQVRVARALAELPRTREAFSKGAISYSKVRALTRIASPASEEYLLTIAEYGTAYHLEKVVRGVRRVQRERELRDANERHRNRGLHWRLDDDEMMTITVRLDAEQGARFLAAVNKAAEAIGRERDDDVSAEAFGIAGEPEPDDAFAARRADALVRLVDGPNPDTEIVVHVSAGALRDDAGSGCGEPRGCCEIEDTAAIPPESARRLACDAGVVRLVESAGGQPLDVGRKTRSIPPALRRALKARDGGCRFPGCDATAHVEGHHVRHWADGGATSMRNLVSLCRHHHRLVHEGGFGVAHRGHGVFGFARPDGVPIAETAPRVVVQGDPRDALLRANEALGLRIDETTGVCRWDGLPMDEVQAVDNALAAMGELEWR